MQEELELLKDFEKDSVWVKSHKRELRKEFTNQFVAVKDRKVIESDKDLERLIENLKAKNINPSFVAIEFIPEKDTIVIY